jgi:hypothetical protein
MLFSFNLVIRKLMTSIIKQKILHINNFNILLFNYKQLLEIFKNIEEFIEIQYDKRNINKYQRNNYLGVIIDIKFRQCKRHIEYFKFKKIVKIKSLPLFNNNYDSDNDDDLK